MKRVFASILALTVLAGAEHAEANWFWHHNADNNMSQVQRTNYNSSEDQRWVYNGDNSYRTISSQVAVRDRMNDRDDTAFVVHPVYGSRINASLRQGDTGQSTDTRMNGTFNN